MSGPPRHPCPALPVTWSYGGAPERYVRKEKTAGAFGALRVDRGRERPPGPDQGRPAPKPTRWRTDASRGAWAFRSGAGWCTCRRRWVRKCRVGTGHRRRGGGGAAAGGAGGPAGGAGGAVERGRRGERGAGRARLGAPRWQRARAARRRGAGDRAGGRPLHRRGAGVDRGGAGRAPVADRGQGGARRGRRAHGGAARGGCAAHLRGLGRGDVSPAGRGARERACRRDRRAAALGCGREGQRGEAVGRLDRRPGMARSGARWRDGARAGRGGRAAAGVAGRGALPAGGDAARSAHNRRGRPGHHAGDRDLLQPGLRHPGGPVSPARPRRRHPAALRHRPRWALGRRLREGARDRAAAIPGAGLRGVHQGSGAARVGCAGQLPRAPVPAASGRHAPRAGRIHRVAHAAGR